MPTLPVILPKQVLARLDPPPERCSAVRETGQHAEVRVYTRRIRDRFLVRVWICCWHCSYREPEPDLGLRLRDVSTLRWSDR